jgi:hypothetical protein
MKRTWAIIGVADVARSFKWYQSLFGQPESVPAHDYFGQVLDTDGTVLLCQSTRGEPQTNPATGTREFALRDPDGYYVMVSALA